jgi:estrone sulfotransferase
MNIRKKLLSRERNRHYRKSSSILRDPRLNRDDVMLVSYPRSGNTWMRMIVAHILYPHERINSLKDLKALVPDIYTSFAKNIKYSTPRVIKTHQPYSFRHEPKNPELYRRNIYVVRHPYDVITSYYDFQLRLWRNTSSFETSMDRFVEKVVHGAYAASWQEHVLSWYCMRNELEILFVKYEDLRSQTGEQIAWIGEFLGRQLSADEIERICERTSLESMRSMEQNGSLIDRDYAFVRKEDEQRKTGVELSPELKELIAKHSNIAMDLFEYKP